MNLLRPIHVALLTGALTCVFAACSGSVGTSATSGEGGTSASVGVTSASASGSGSGSGGNEAPDASAPDVVDFCPGDVGLWEKLTAEPTPCQSGTECCVIISGCLSQAQVVGAAHKEEASAAWPHCDLACVDCVAPAVEVACVAGMCRGRVIQDASPDSPLRTEHCGADVAVVDFSGPSGLHFGCGG